MSILDKNGAKMRSQTESLLSPCCPLAPKEALWAPKGSPRAPQEPPRPHIGAPASPQGHSRHHFGAPGFPPEGSQGSHFGHQKTPKGSTLTLFGSFGRTFIANLPPFPFWTWKKHPKGKIYKICVTLAVIRLLFV